MKHAHPVMFALLCFTIVTKVVAFYLHRIGVFGWHFGILWSRFSILGMVCTTCTGV
jgi:hypothetical protein